MGATLGCGARASHCSGFSCCGAWALGTWPSVVVAHGLTSCGLRALECRLSSCGAQAWLLCGMWDLPGPGLEPVSPALAGGFLTTAPPGKSPYLVFLFFFYKFIYLFYYLFLAALVLHCCVPPSLVVASRGHSSPQCAGLSLQWSLSPRSTGSRRVGFSSCGLRAPEHRLSSCGTRA